MQKNSCFNKKLGLNIILKLSIPILIVNLLFMFIYTDTKTHAEENENNIIILIDNSLSMRDLGLSNLSKIAGNMLLDSVNENVNVGIITFGTQTTVLNRIKESKDIERLKEKLNNVSFDEKGTNMKDGIKKSIEELNTAKGKKTIIILSDGHEEIEGGIPSNHFEEMNDLINEAYKSNIIVHAIALSDDIDKSYLTKITDKTSGSLRDGKSANKLFEALTSIIGVENDFITVANYSTELKNKEKIKLSSMIEEVIINVAACDNVNPQITVKLNGKIIEPSNLGELYQLYKFESLGQSEIEIESLNQSDTSVIVQLKSKAKLNIKYNSNNYLSVPMNIPIKYELELLCDDDKIPEGTFVERVDAKLDYSDKRNIFIDTYEGRKLGEESIIYTAKDGAGGIIAMAELAISINDYPPYYYDNPTNLIIKGDKLRVSVIPKDNTEVKELGGMLIIKQGEEIKEIPLSNYNNELIGEAEINEVGKTIYYVCLRGVKVSSNSNFEYNLPVQYLEVKDRSNIVFDTQYEISKNISLGKKEKIVLNILPESVIPNNTNIMIYDLKKNNIGNFTIKKDTTGKVEVEIEPKDKCNKLILFFKCDSKYGITEKLETDIRVMSKLGFILEEYGKPVIKAIIILTILGAILITIYFYGIKSYKKNIEGLYKVISITYEIGSRRSGACEAKISNINSPVYINYNDKSDEVSLDDELKNVIGIFEYKNKYGDSMKWYQGLMWKITKGKIVKINYIKQVEQEQYYKNELIEEEIDYKNGIKIICKINKKEIEIEF